MRLLKTRKHKDDEAFLRGWNGPTPLEQESERKKMSAHIIAERLANCDVNTPAYILLEHELNRRIARTQALPVYISIIMTLVGIVIGWGLSQWKPFESHTSLDIIAQHIQENNKTRSASNSSNTADYHVPKKPSTTSNINPSSKFERHQK